MSHKIHAYTLIAAILVSQAAWAQTRPKVDLPRDVAFRSRSAPKRDLQTDMTQQLASAQSQARRLQAEHRKLSDELKAIQALAKEEKAQKTLAMVSELIEARQKQHTAQITRLNQRVQKIRAALASFEKRNQASNRINTVAPTFSARTLTGQRINSSQNKGKIVVLEWFNPECQFTRYAYQRGKLTQLARQYANRDDVTWLSVCSAPSKRPASLLKFVESHKIERPVIDDAKGQMAELFYAKATPQFIVVGKDGRIAYSGAFDNSLPKPKNGKITGYVANALTELLQGKPVTTPSTPVSGTPIKSGRPR